jgi:hypothetical protein
MEPTSHSPTRMEPTTHTTRPTSHTPTRMTPQPVSDSWLGTPLPASRRPVDSTPQNTPQQP